MDGILLWAMRTVCLGALIVAVLLFGADVETSTAVWAIALGLCVLGVVGLAASVVRRLSALRIFVSCFLVLMLAFWLSLDLLVLRVEWWEWPIAAVTQMGLPAIVAWYVLRSRKRHV